MHDGVGAPDALAEAAEGALPVSGSTSASLTDELPQFTTTTDPLLDTHDPLRTT